MYSPDIWWRTITGPRSLVETAARSLSDNRSVLLVIPDDLPWPLEMRYALESEFRNRYHEQDLVVQPVEASEIPEGTDPGRWILDRFGSRAARQNYRPQSGMTMQAYLAKNNILRNSLIWIRGLGGQRALEWISFCRQYSPLEHNNGLFILETADEGYIPEGRDLDVVDYRKRVSVYDVQLFNSILIDARRTDLPGIWKTYIAAVAASLCGADAELSGALIEKTWFLAQDPVKTMTNLAFSPDFSGRGRQPGHILQQLREGDEADARRCVWQAQIQTAFPAIEMERTAFIRERSGLIREALAKNEVRSFGQVITEPEELELGTLYFMISARDADGAYLLFLPDEEVRQRLRFLRDCRNDLAHMGCCSPECLVELFRA